MNLRHRLAMSLAGFVWLLISSAAQAADYRFLLWYPGAGGSSAQAAPLMQQFAQYLSHKMPGTQWTAQYVNTVKAGVAAAKTPATVAGIISPLMLAQQGSALGMTTLLHTRPAVHGKTQEAWVFVQGPCAAPSPQTHIVASEPLREKDLTSHFEVKTLSAYGTPLRMRVIDNAALMQELRDIAGGNCNAAVMSEREWATLARTNLAWRANLHESISVGVHPTAAVVQFGRTTSNVNAQIVETLTHMEQDETGRALLQELQLKGFAP